MKGICLSAGFSVWLNVAFSICLPEVYLPDLFKCGHDHTVIKYKKLNICSIDEPLSDFLQHIINSHVTDMIIYVVFFLITQAAWPFGKQCLPVGPLILSKLS